MDDELFHKRVKEQLEKFRIPIDKQRSYVLREIICANKKTIKRICEFEKGFISPLSCVEFVEGEYMADDMVNAVYSDDDNRMFDIEIAQNEFAELKLRQPKIVC